jgi:hypothetical protein
MPDVLRSMNELKNQVHEMDVQDRYTTLIDKHTRSSILIDPKMLKMVKELDNKIINSEALFFQCLNSTK